MKIFDSHFHIIDPKFPLKENNGFIPDLFTLSDYQEKTADLNIAKGTIVSASFQEYDQTYLLHALETLGNGFYGVTQLPIEQITERKIAELTEKRVRGLRFNIYNGMGSSIEQIAKIAHYVYDVAGWHIDLHITSKQLKEISSDIERLPAVVVDHLGLTADGFSTLLNLVSHGIKVKASGFGRVDFNVEKAIQQIHSENPEALLFGTDLPSTRVERRFKSSDVDLIIEALGSTEAEKVLFTNAEKWYR